MRFVRSASKSAALRQAALQTLTLPTTTFTPSVAGTVYATFQKERTGSTRVLIVDAGGRFVLNSAGDQLIAGVTANTVGNYSITIRETKNSVHRDTTIVITLAATGVTLTGSLTNIVWGQPTSQPLTVAGGSGNYTVAISAGSLPPGISVALSTNTVTESGTAI